MSDGVGLSFLNSLASLFPLACLRFPASSHRTLRLNPSQGRFEIRSLLPKDKQTGVDSDVSRSGAVLTWRSPDWFLQDTASSSGTFLNGTLVKAPVRIAYGDEIRFGSVVCVFESGVIAGFVDRITKSTEKSSGVSLGASILIHLAVVVLMSTVVLTSTQKEVSDFQSDQPGFLVEEAPRGEPPGGDAAAGPPSPDFVQAPPTPSTSVPVSAITTTAPSSFNFASSMASVPGPAVAPSALSTPKSGGGGGSSYRSAGLGKGSGFGKGVRDWVGGGAGGIGISGRGKKLKTINEFAVYFVIHSGDWYAALDTREASDERQVETSQPDLPDVKNIKWGTTTPKPLQGPFVNYFWGGNYRKKDSLEMRSLVEFTPGAMGNLLRFVRMASGNEIKGSAKPAAVVLDKALVPYNYDKTTKQLEWNAAGREALRETLRKGLPASKNIYADSFGYIWNPQPTDKGHPDFTVEYLLDVKPMPPFIYFTGNDDFVLSEAEVDTLYQYILRGGAIWGDSGFAGDRSKFDIAFKREMRRVIPDSDKSFRPLKKENDLFISGADAYFDRESGFDQLPYGMQFYDAPIEVIEAMPGLVSVVLTKNAYGNFLRFETALVNNRFQIGGDIGRGLWATTMWNNRERFFRGLSEESIVDTYKLGTNILVYMLGRWPAVLSRAENKALLE